MCSLFAASANAGSLLLFENAQGNYDYLRQNTIPANFGSGPFTLEIWVKLNNALPIGSTASGLGQRQNWSDANPAPYSSANWWYEGNFLLDGHNNNNSDEGSFDLQVFNGGRLRWLFGDGLPASQRTGLLHAVQNPSSRSLLDGQWHQVTLVRRANTGGGATLEMWIDGSLIDTETSSAMTDMRTWWNNWPGFPNNQAGWFWGAEKQAAIGTLPQYEDYKGNIDELRFWSIAKSPQEIAASYSAPVTGSEGGLAGHFTFEGAACNQVNDTTCMALSNAVSAGSWSAENAPLTATGDTTPPSTPANLQSTATQNTSVTLGWQASTDNVAVAGYRITRNGTVIVNTVAGTSYTDTGLSPATLYTYTVTAVDTSANLSSAATLSVTTSSIADTQAPSVPTNLRTTTTSATRVDLAWNSSTDNQGVASYLIYRGGVLAGTSASPSFSDGSVAANTAYSYTVAARDAAGNTSAESTALSVSTPAAPVSPPTPATPSGDGGGGGMLGLELLPLLLMANLARLRRRATRRSPSP